MNLQTTKPRARPLNEPINGWKWMVEFSDGIPLCQFGETLDDALREANMFRLQVQQIYKKQSGTC